MIWGQRETGVAVATRRLIQGFDHFSKTHQFTQFVARDFGACQYRQNGHDGIRTVSCPRHRGGWRLLWQQLHLPSLAHRHGVDVLYCPCYTIPFLARVPTIVTIHDLIAFKRPDLCAVRNLLHFRLMVHESARRAHCITAPTESVKADILEQFPFIPDDKVHVVPWGVDQEIQPFDRETAVQLVRQQFNISDRFVLFVSRIEPKKNLASVVEATRMLGIPLVVVGDADLRFQSTRHLLQVMKSKQVHYLGYVSPTELSALYAAAMVVAFPSHIEGFGLPVLEAMACGTPVVTSQAPALEEISGGAAIHVPAEDVDMLARKFATFGTTKTCAKNLAGEAVNVRVNILGSDRGCPF